MLRLRWTAAQFAEKLGISETEFVDIWQAFVRQSATPEAFEEFWSRTRVSPSQRDHVQRQLRRRYKGYVSKQQRRQQQRDARLECSMLVARPPGDAQTTPRILRIVWVAFPDNPKPWHVRESKSLCIEIDRTGAKAFGGIPWLDVGDLRKLDEFKQYWSVDQKGDIAIHQGLAVALSLRWRTGISFEFRTWHSIQQELTGDQGFQPTLSRDESSKTLYILHCTTSRPPDLLEVARRLDTPSTRTFPSSTELTWQEDKLSDLETLNKIAESSARFRWRPRTCDGEGECTLKDPVTVAKRQNSCGGAHVKILVHPDRGELCCRRPGQRGRTKTTSGPSWFHQEYVAPLARMEYRVIIFMKKNPAGLRERSAYVAKKVTTVCEWGGELWSQAFRPEHLADAGGLSERDLDKIALEAVEGARRMPDSHLHYETLEVGCRVDVGVNNAGQPFVGEITRLTCSHLFSLCFAEPYTELVELYAQSLKDYLLGG